jgi:DNA-binding SARP family transcriptional activator/WD40 repeat protein
MDVDGSGLGPRDRVVLAVLAMRPGEVVSTERLADALWADQPPATWKRVLPGCVMRLRRALGADAIETQPRGYRLVIPADEVDAHRFERLVGRGRELLAVGEPDRAAHVLGEALGLWRGRALVDLEEWETARIEAARLEELRRDAEELRLEAALACGRHRDVLGEAQSRVAEAPLRERRWALLALAQYRSGRQGEALRTLHGARTALATELGVDPGPDLVALEQAILRQDPSLVTDDSRPPASATCPYPGLVAYAVDDADMFFGRDADVAACLRRLATVRMLAVVGPSGSGKSSLARAGVAAALERDGDRVVIITPGPHPTRALDALSGPGPAPTLIVDQCEEAVSLCTDPAERNRFFAALVEHARRAPLVLTVRADRLGDVSAHPELARLIERGLHLLGPMDEADLRAAIEGPAHQAGLLLEPGLVDLLVREVEGEPGALPLLSHALRQTWERREGRTLTVAGYRDSGGIRGAVAQTAEAIYERVPAEQRPLLRDLLLRLVTPGNDGEPIPTPVRRRTMTSDAEHERLVEMLVGARLVASDDGVIELAHESLARAWPRLQAWLDEDIEGHRIRRHLSDVVDAWDGMGRPDSELYRGVRLDRALEWRGRTRPSLTPAECSFIDASREASRRDRRAGRRVRTLVAGIAVLVVAAVATAAVAFDQARRADTAREAGDAGRVAAQSSARHDIELSLLLAVEGVRLDDNPDTRAALLAALMRDPTLVASAHQDAPIEVLTVNPANGDVAIGGAFGDVSILAGDTLDPVGTHEAAPRLLEYRPDGEQIAIATYDEAGDRDIDRAPLMLMDADTFEPEPAQLGGMPSDAVAQDLGYSADGRFLAAALARSEAGFTVLVWDAEVPERPIVEVESDPVWGIALNPDGTRLYVGTDEPRSVTAYDVTTGRALDTEELPSEEPADATSDSQPAGVVDVSPDGSTVAVADGAEVVLLDGATLTERDRRRGHSVPVTTIKFSPDGRLLAAGSSRRVVVWNVTTGASEELSGHTGPVTGLGFSADGGTLYSASEDQGVLAWDVGGTRRLVPRVADLDLEAVGRRQVAVSPDADAVAYIESEDPVAASSGTIRFLDVASGRMGAPVALGRGSSRPAWRAPDFERVAVADEEGYVRVWNWRTGALVSERRVVAGPLAALTYTEDGAHLVVGEGSIGPSVTPGALHQLDAETLQPVRSAIPLDYDVRDIAVSADGRTAIVLYQGDLMTPVDLSIGRVSYEKYLGFEARTAEVSPDGRSVAVVCENGAVAVVDAETGDWIQQPWAPLGHVASDVAYAPDGETFATGGLEETVGLWDGASGLPLGTIGDASRARGSAAEFSPDGHTLVIATLDGSVYTWDNRIDHWIEHACSVAGRNLTADEWRDAFADRPYRETCSTG